MGVQIIEDLDNGYKCLMCNTTMVVFGDVFYDHENVEDFLEWLIIDPRDYDQNDLSKKISEWRRFIDEQKEDIC